MTVQIRCKTCDIERNGTPVVAPKNATRGARVAAWTIYMPNGAAAQEWRVNGMGDDHTSAECPECVSAREALNDNLVKCTARHAQAEKTEAAIIRKAWLTEQAARAVEHKAFERNNGKAKK